MAIRYLSGINVDSNTLFVDSTNNRVGIGTPSPEQQFHLQGSNLMATFQNSDTSANQYTQLEFVAGSRSAYIWLGNQNSTSWAGDGGLNIYTTTGNMDLWTAASQRMRITSGGNVLIGTTTDAGYKLYLSGNQGTVGTSFYLGTLNGTAIAIDHSGINTWRIGVNNTNTSTFSIGNDTGGTFASKYLNITNAGNVGIGTISPSYKTSVVAANGNYWNGTAFTGTPLALSIENSEPGGYDPVLIYNQADSGGTLKNSGAIGMIGTAPWTAGDDAAQVSDMYFLVRNSSGALQERARLKSNGHLILKSTTSGGGTQGDFYVIENGGLVIDASEGATQRYIEFTTGGTSKALITAGGNFLIGTTTDSGYKLQVAGTYLQSSASTEPFRIYGDSAGTNGLFRIQFDEVSDSFGDGARTFLGDGGIDIFIGTSNSSYSPSNTYIALNQSGEISMGAGSSVTKDFTLKTTGQLQLNNYGSGSFTGTVAYNLAVDSSGNIIETAGGVVDGSGTANQLARWQDANTLTNAGIEDTGSAISIGRDAFYSSTNYGIAYSALAGASGGTAWFDTVTVAGARLYNITIFANPNVNGSGSYRDFYYGKIIVGNGYNGSAVVDFINYHQESPQPRSLYGSGGGNLTVTAVFVYGGSEVTEVPSGATYTIRIKIAGYNGAGAGTQINLQRIM